MSMPVPLEVPPPATSRQSPDWTPTMVPLDFTVHSWLAPPLQVQISTFVPGLVCLSRTSRHLPVAPLTSSAVPPVPDAGTALISATPPSGTFLAVWLPLAIPSEAPDQRSVRVALPYRPVCYSETLTFALAEVLVLNKPIMNAPLLSRLAKIWLVLVLPIRTASTPSWSTPMTLVFFR